MNKLICVCGLPGTGKTTYIQKHFANHSDYYIFDLAQQSKRMFGSYIAFEDGDHIADIYNQSSEDALFALLDGKNLIFEFGKGQNYHDDFENLLKFARKKGLQVEQIYLEEVFSYPFRESSDEHYCSFLYGQESLEVLEGVLESFGMNQFFEMIMELSTDNGVLRLFKFLDEDETAIYFYTNEQDAVFDFEPKFEFEKIEGVDYKHTFHSFEEALQDMDLHHSIFNYSPIIAHPDYQTIVTAEYHKKLKEGKAFSSAHAWKEFLN